MAVLDGGNFLAVAYAVDCNPSAATDTFVPIPSGGKNVFFTHVYVTNATTNLSTSTATVGVYTQTAAGGTAIVTGATGTITSNTTSTYVKDATIAASTTAFNLLVSNAPTTFNGSANNEAGVYIRVAGTPNVAGKIDVYFSGHIFS